MQNPTESGVQLPFQPDAPDLYELLGLPLWTIDAESIAAACSRRIDAVRADRGLRPWQRQRQIGELVKARNLLTNPTTREEYNELLHSELDRRAELANQSASKEALRTEQQPPTAETRSAAETMTFAHQVARRSAAEESAPTPPDESAADASETPPSPQSSPWRSKLPARRIVFSALRFMAAVIVAAIAVNLAFFRPPATNDAPVEPLPGTANTVGRPFRAVERATTAPEDHQHHRPQPTAHRVAADLADDNQIPIAPPKAVAQDPGFPFAKNAGSQQPAAAVVDDGPKLPEIPLQVAVRSLPESLNPDDRTAFAKLLRDMLYEGFGSGKSALERSTELFRQAEAISQDDPRLYYGLGLVLWKRLQYSEAMQQFAAAAAIEESYWPARQAQIRQHLARREFDEGFDQLNEMVYLLHKRPNADATADDLQAACWLGRLIGYLQQPAGGLSPDPQQVTVARDLAERRLTGELLASFRAGQQRLNEEYLLTTSDSEQQLDELVERAKQEAATELKDLEQKLEQQKDQKEGVNRTSEQWKEWIDKQTAEADEELKELTQQYGELYAQAQAIRSEIARLDADRAARLNLGPGATAIAGVFPAESLGSFDPSSYSREYYGQQPLAADRHTATRARLRSQYNVLDNRAGMVRLQAVAVARRRAEAVLRFQQATGLLVEKSDELRKWDELLAKRKQELQQFGDEVPSDPKARAIRRRANSLDSYVEFNLAAERRRILDSLPAE